MSGLTDAIVKFAGDAQDGAIAFLRTSDSKLITRVHQELHQINSNQVLSWLVFIVDGDISTETQFTIRGDQAVEMREDKGAALVLIVNDRHQESGLDGIFSSGREIDENSVLSSFLESVINAKFSKDDRKSIERALMVSRRHVASLEHFDEIELVELSQSIGDFLENVWRVGLWPIDRKVEGTAIEQAVDTSGFLVHHLLKVSSNAPMPPERLAALNIIPNDNNEDPVEVSRFISECDKTSVYEAFLKNPLDKRFFIGSWALELSGQDDVKEISIESWRSSTGKIAQWSGLSSDANSDLEYVIDLDSKSEIKDLVVRWTTSPKDIGKGKVQFHIELFIGDESKAIWEVQSSGKIRNDFRIHADVFEIEAGDSYDARVEVSFRGEIRDVTETFTVRDGQTTKKSNASSNRTYRTVTEFLLELDDPEAFRRFARNPESIATCEEKEITLHHHEGKKPIKGKIKLPWGWRNCYRLMEEQKFPLGRFTLEISRAGKILPTSLTLHEIDGGLELKSLNNSWDSMIKRWNNSSSAYGSCIAENQDAIKFANAWREYLETSWGETAHVNTISVIDYRGETKALILLPENPVRILNRIYYDQFLEFISGEGKATDKRSIYESVSGNGFPIVYPAIESDAPFTFFRSSEALDIHTQLLLAPSISDDDSLPTQIRHYWYLDDPEKFETATDRRWQSEQITKEINATIQVAEPLEGSANSTTRITHNSVIVASFGGADGSVLLDAMTDSHEAESVLSTGRTEIENSNTAFSVSMFPSLRYHNSSIVEKSQLDVIGNNFEDLWELARKSKSEVPPRFRWIFDRVGKMIKPPQFPLIWKKGTIEDYTNELHDGSGGFFHLVIIFAIGRNDAVALDIKDFKMVRPKSMLFGLIRAWDTQKEIGDDGLQRTITFYDDLAEADRFDSRRTKNYLADATNLIEKRVREGISGDGSTIAFIKTISEAEKDFIIDAHSRSEKIVILDSGAMEVYRARGIRQGEFLIGETVANNTLSVKSSITAVRTSTLIGIGYKPLSHDIRMSQDNDKAVQFIISALSVIPGGSQIYYTDRNDRAVSALKFVLGYLAIDLDRTLVGAPKNEGIVMLPLIDLPKAFLPENQAGRIDATFAVLRVKATYLSLSFTYACTEAELINNEDKISQFLIDCHKLWGSAVALNSSLKAWNSRVALAKVIEQHLRGASSAVFRQQQVKTLQEKISDLRRITYDTLPIEWDNQENNIILCIDSNLDEQVEPLIKIRSIQSNQIVEAFYRQQFASGGDPVFDESTVQVQAVAEIIPHLAATDTLPELLSSSNESIIIPSEDLNVISSHQNEITTEHLMENTSQSSITTDMHLDPIAESVIPTTTEPNHQINDESDKLKSPNDGPTIAQKVIIEVGNSKNSEAVFWQPSITSNPHMIVTGLSGVGKTTFLMGLVKQLSEQNITPIVISFHQDVDEIMSDFFGEDMNVSDINNASFNPLYFTREELNTNKYIVNELSSNMSQMLSLLFPSLGDIQLGQFREGIARSYPRDLASEFEEDSQPTLLDVFRRLNRSGETDKNLLVRLRDLFTYESLFESNCGRSFLNSPKPTIIKLSSINSDLARLALLIFSTDGLYREMIRRGIKTSITHALVIDEAHLMRNFEQISRFAREARKYGISLILGSQRFDDFDDDVTANAGTAVFFQSNEDDAKKVSKHIEHNDQQRETVDMIRRLAKHHAIFYGTDGHWQEIITKKMF